MALPAKETGSHRHQGDTSRASSNPRSRPPSRRSPSGDRWLHEIKFDGYRVQVHLANEAVKVFTRRGNDWTKRFRKIADDAWHVSAGSAIIDGEVKVDRGFDHGTRPPICASA